LAVEKKKQCHVKNRHMNCNVKTQRRLNMK